VPFALSFHQESKGHLPQVSVLVRTIGRDTLAKAIESVVQQSFKDWEIVVVNAGVNPIPENLLDGVPKDRLRCIEQGRTLDRSTAANELLDAAWGSYAMFLDDDDWLLPDHLTKLVKVLDAEPDLVAAYADVQMMVGQWDALSAGHLFAFDFDPLRLQFENYLPIHSVLFRRAAVEVMPSCRFDTALQLFEDWDFWLQMTVRGPFRRVPGVSAVYVLNADSGSGHAQLQSEQRQRSMVQLAARQLVRWTPQQVAELMKRFTAQAAEIQQHQQAGALQLTTLNAVREEMRKQLSHAAAQQQEIRTLELLRLQHLQQLETMYRSRSWRITRPLRGLFRAVRWLRHVQITRLVRRIFQAVGVELRRHGLAGFLARLPSYLLHWRAYLPRLVVSPAIQVSDFHASPPTPHDFNVHPDLTGGGDTLDVTVSVVIPTLNAGPEFRWLLRKLGSQKAIKHIEIVVVDSGSTDNTVTWAREAGCTVVEILPSEFSHSHARNLGADAASGDHLLFMVQDAYPIGEHWLYGMTRFLLDHADQKVVAASCAEYSRSDSDMMYDAMVHTHYRFLGCLEYDRIGEHQGDDHIALRSQGQLSDVSCLISRECFMRYRYQGDYAEDLDLGIRLIKDGYRVAMLASVKVIHSHNRPAYYYLKRSFVDVIFLVGLFKDFSYPRCESVIGLLSGVVSTAAHVADWLEQLQSSSDAKPLGDEIRDWVKASRQTLSELRLTGAVDLGDQRLNQFLTEVSQRHLGAPPVLDGRAQDEARRFSDSFLARLEHFNQFAAAVYGPQDSVLRDELRDVVRKTFAATAGSALAFFYLDRRGQIGPEAEMADAIYRELKAGV
jgi:glycosyltransferase involved in cell wall biosynthesis